MKRLSLRYVVLGGLVVGVLTTIGFIVIGGTLLIQNLPGETLSMVFVREPDRAPITIEGTDLEVLPVNTDFSIYAPYIGLNAPIFENINGKNKNEYLANVLSGIAHYRREELGDVIVDGALPGDKGNIFLFGHSQIPGASMENYQGVFNVLQDFIIGDEFRVFYRGDEYVYQVIEKKIVDKTAIEYTSHTDSEIVTMMTCWPFGLDVKRVIVRAIRL